MMSDYARKPSARRQDRRGAWRGLGTGLLSALALAGVLAAGPVHAQGAKIGFVNTERILRDSGPARAAQAKIESEFKRRDEELQRRRKRVGHCVPVRTDQLRLQAKVPAYR